MPSQTYIKVLQSKFMQSAQTINDCPAASCTEIAVLGRSNVGKSSIINLLLNHKLAKSSSTPGKTKLINFFSTTWEVCHTQDFDGDLQGKNLIESEKISLVIVDFPGFGYAKVSKNVKKIWDKHLTDFICRRQSIKLFCHLIDSRHRELEIDYQISSFLQGILESRKDCNILQIYTKDDKLSKSEYYRLKAQGKLTISTLKKTPNATQNLYQAVLHASLNTITKSSTSNHLT